MSAHWAMQRYAFGAGRVALRPEPYRGADRELGALAGARARIAGVVARGKLACERSARRPCALLLGAWLVAALIAGALRDRDTTSGLEIVMLETPALAGAGRDSRAGADRPSPSP